MVNVTVIGSTKCQVHLHIKSEGIFHGDNPLKFATPVLLIHLSIPAILIAIFHLYLHPLGQSSFFSQMLTDIVLGPTIWGDDNSFSKNIYPYRSIHVNNAFALFGSTLFLFLLGVKTDLSMVKRTGRKSVIIGLISFAVPITLNTILASFLKHNFILYPELQKSLYYIAAFLSLNSFHVVVSLLADLNLLNSELGQLATSSSLVSGSLSWFWVIATFTIAKDSGGKSETAIWMFLSLGCLVMLIIYVLRPAMLTMVRHTTEGKPMQESHIMTVFLMILGCLLISEFIGYHMIIGPMFFGVARPEGPPLGSALVSKLDPFVSSILLPSYLVIAGYDVNILRIHSLSTVVIEVMSFCNFLGKLSVIVLSSLYCKMPPVDAICLGLIMSAQGITDVMILLHALSLALIDQQSYTIMSVTLVLLTGIITPLVKFLYKPSKGYVFHKRRAIQHSHPETELRLLAGIYSQYQTPSIINLLELSNPTRKSPICFSVVHLQELIGRSSALLITHRPDRKSSLQMQNSEHMINAFRLYEQSNEGAVVVNLFTAVSPYATMHDEVCGLALEKRVSLVIVPFHKQYLSSDNEMELLSGPMVRSVNQQILQNAPCSVGILVDRGSLTGTSSMSSKTLYSIGMIFVEGPDDREALAYVMRMGEHPNIKISVTRLVDPNKTNEGSLNQELDERIVNDFKIAHIGKKHHLYKEEIVCESVETVEAIRSMENSYDLILVGRRHDNNLPYFMGLTQWNEFPELGFMGDVLASSDSGCQVSVLVMQQQTISECKKTETGCSNYDDSCIVVDIVPHKFSRVYPQS